jgi:hypothetical protein
MKVLLTNQTLLQSGKGQKGMKMKRSNMNKAIATLTITSLALAAMLTYGLMGGHTTSAKSAYSPSNLSAAPAAISTAAAAVQTTTSGIVLPKTPVYALNADNVISVLVPGTTSFVRLVRVTQTNGNLIGIDFRVADGKNTSIYALTDVGSIYTINLTASGLGAATLVSNQTTRFPSGVQSTFDFNAVLNAIREIGSDTSNYAVVNSGGNLNTTAVQTSLTYGTGDVNAGKRPHVSAGAYDTNVVGATTTRYYAIDYDLDTFLTIQPATAGGSSNTGGGVLQTLGNLVNTAGQRVNVSSTGDVDIYTLSTGRNNLVGVSGRTFFTIDLTKVNPNVPAGSVTNIVTNSITMPNDSNEMIDIAAAPTSYEAENGTQAGGNIVEATNLGFSGTGYANFTDNVAGGNTTIQVNQSGAQTLIFRYANGGAVNRPCTIAVNGTVVGTVAFPPTGSFTTYKTVTLPVTLPTSSAFKAVKITSTTAAGGPNLDKINVE